MHKYYTFYYIICICIVLYVDIYVFYNSITFFKNELSFLLQYKENILLISYMILVDNNLFILFSNNWDTRYK